MRERLRRFAVVGLVATTVDIVLLVVLRRVGWTLVAADLAALVAAALVARPLHRLITLRDDPFARWIRSPGLFVSVVLTAGAVDVFVLTQLAPTEPGSGDLAAKAAAVAAAAVVRSLAYRTLLFRVIRREQDEPARRPPPEGAFRLSVVVPAYREADRIAATVSRIRAELASVVEPADLEIVVADDGSDDATAAAAEAAGADVVVRLDRNRGKGAALREGVRAASGRTVAFTDADLAYAPSQIADLLEAVESGHDMVVGSRRHAGSQAVVRAGRLRQAGGRLVNLATHALLLGQYRDTQCGLKAFRSDVARALFEATTVDGFAFDVELFHLAERWRLTLAEVPVQVEHSERTTVRALHDGLAMLGNLVRIRQRARRGVYPADAGLPKAGNRA
jgi:dolichyl-phosphate beta-glucosyltransferase